MNCKAARTTSTLCRQRFQHCKFIAEIAVLAGSSVCPYCLSVYITDQDPHRRVHCNKWSLQLNWYEKGECGI